MSDDLLSFRRDGSRLEIQVRTGPEVLDYPFTFTYQAGSDWIASMLLWHMRGRLCTLLEQIRGQAYEQGWKDAKSHAAPKRTWFSSRLRVGDQ